MSDPSPVKVSESCWCGTEDPVETARWEAEKLGVELPVPTPLPSGPFVWVVTLPALTTHEAADQVVRRLTATLPGDVRDRSRIILLAPGWTLQALGDDELRDLGLQRIEAP